MKPLEYRGHALSMDGVALADIAEREGTPLYVYSAATIAANYRAYDDAFGDDPHTVCYAVKANSNLSVLRLLASMGAGFDIVSGGELFRVLRAGGDPRKIVFSGVGKTAPEIEAALDAEILCFNCESEDEMALIDSLAGRRGVKARVALRVNPGVKANTHAKIATGHKDAKFGIDIDEAEAVYLRAREAYPHLSIESVSCHIGSSQLDIAPMLAAADRVLQLIDRLRALGFAIRYADLGGGLGVAYRRRHVVPPVADLIAPIRAKFAERNLHFIVEPGRSIVGDAGVLLTRVLYRKRTGVKEFVVVDAAMNDLIRPTLYKAHHEILPMREARGKAALIADVVGPICESGDFFAKKRRMPEVQRDDLLAICTAGAYGFVQAGNYNSRPRVAEVLVENGGWRVVRTRETLEDLVRGE